jgi:hypothetical protein
MRRSGVVTSERADQSVAGRVAGAPSTKEEAPRMTRARVPSRSDVKTFGRRLLARLDKRARAALNDWRTAGPSLHAHPHLPATDEPMAEPLGHLEHLARSVLRLYPWDPPAVDEEASYAWKAVHENGLDWRPVGPDWDPRPATEELSYCEEADVPKPLVDARRPAFMLLFHIADLRRAMAEHDAARAACAAFQVAEMRAALVSILELGPVLDAGWGTVTGGQKAARAVADPDRWRRWREMDEELKARGVERQHQRAKMIAERTGTRSEPVSANTVRDRLRIEERKTPRSRPRKK